MTWGELLNRLLGLFRWWVVVVPWEQGIRIWLGKKVTPLNAGLHLKIPGLHRVYVQTTRLRTVDLGVQTISTRDGRTVTVSGTVRYRIADLWKLYETLHAPEDTLLDLTMAAIAEFVATHDSGDVTPRTVEDAIAASLDFTSYGLADGAANITDFAFVKTYRLIQSDRRYSRTDSLNTMLEAHRLPG